MTTKLYKRDISTLVKNKTYENTYNFFSNYEETNGQPKMNLIFLDYNNFDTLIKYFFTRLVQYLISTNNYTNIKLISDFSECVEDFFVGMAISSGKITKSLKNKYENLNTANSNEFNELIDELKNIKFFFRDKYINIFNNIRDDYGDKLQKENEIFLCPYCQRNYINIIQEDSFTIKPDLDHFYPKAKYPFLASSIENLVPSCQVCNSRLKKERDFYNIKHLHPLQPSENIFKKIKFLYLGNKNIYIKGKAQLSDKEKQYIKTFKIEEIYNTHNEILDDILEKNKKYNHVKKNHILKTCPSMGMKTIKELVFHEYINIDEKKVPMSSLKKSLFEKIVK